MLSPIQEAQTIKRPTQIKGVDEEALIRKWVFEKLHEG